MFVPLAIPLNDDTVTPGFLGFGVVVALGVALFFLLRSMNTRISRIQAPKDADLRQAAWERAHPVEDEGTAAAAAEPNGKEETSDGPPSDRSPV